MAVVHGGDPRPIMVTFGGCGNPGDVDEKKNKTDQGDDA
jgi:hypothetical protein